MILRRLTANLQAQNWTAIAVEFVLLVMGVYLGILAANWNLERLERQETVRLIYQLDGEMTLVRSNLDSIGKYYEVTGGYATRALAGWQADSDISDSAFVIAAYQASQINGLGTNSSVWADIFGADNLRNIDDLELRRELRRLMTFDYGLINLTAAMSRYREEVRKVIPDSEQRVIRTRCGDQLQPDGNIKLPASCDLTLPAAEAASTAKKLRNRIDLIGELNWHRARIATQLQNIENLRQYTSDLSKTIHRT